MGEAARIAAVGQQAKPEPAVSLVKFRDAVNFAGQESRALYAAGAGTASKCILTRVAGGIEAQTVEGAARPDWIFVPYGNVVQVKFLAGKPA